MTDAAPAPPDATVANVVAKAALYLRVSTGRQAESDLSIPDHRHRRSSASVSGDDRPGDFSRPS
jgi:site-specific DNA recombinase